TAQGGGENRGRDDEGSDAFEQLHQWLLRRISKPLKEEGDEQQPAGQQGASQVETDAQALPPRERGLEPALEVHRRRGDQRAHGPLSGSEMRTRTSPGRAFGGSRYRLPIWLMTLCNASRKIRWRASSGLRWYSW